MKTLREHLNDSIILESNPIETLKKYSKTPDDFMTWLMDKSTLRWLEKEIKSYSGYFSLEIPIECISVLSSVLNKTTKKDQWEMIEPYSSNVVLNLKESFNSAWKKDSQRIMSKMKNSDDKDKIEVLYKDANKIVDEIVENLWVETLFDDNYFNMSTIKDLEEKVSDLSDILEELIIVY